MGVMRMSNEFRRLRGLMLFACEKNGLYRGHHVVDLETPEVELHCFPLTHAVRGGFDEMAASYVEMEGRLAKDEEERLVFVVNFIRESLPARPAASA